jgi:hypothetical protein
MEGGKYYCVGDKTPERKDVSKHASKTFFHRITKTFVHN